MEAGTLVKERHHHPVEAEDRDGPSGHRLGATVVPLEQPARLLDEDGAVICACHPDPAWWDNLRHITARTLVIGGGPDSHLPQDQLAALADRIPDSSYLPIDAGHDVHSTQPEAFLAALLPFLTR